MDVPPQMPDDFLKPVSSPLDELTSVFLVRLDVALQLPRGGVGRAAVLAQLSRDLDAIEFGPPTEDWRTLVRSALIRASEGSGVGADFRAAMSVKNNTALRFWASPLALPPAASELISRARVFLLLDAVARGIPVQPAHIRQIAQLAKQFQKLFSQSKFIAAEDIEQAALASPLSARISKLALKLGQESATPSCLLQPQKIDQEIAVSRPRQDAAGLAGDPIRKKVELSPFVWIKKTSLFTTQVEASGIRDTWECYQTHELKPIIAWLLDGLLAEEPHDYALTAILIFLTALPARKLEKLDISWEFDPRHPLHISLETGQIWLNVGDLINQPHSLVPGGDRLDGDIWSRWAPIPLPSGINKALQRRFGRGFAGRYGEVINCSSRQFQRRLKQFLNRCQFTSRGLRQSFLRGSYARLLLDLSRDEVYASICGLDMTVTTTANFNYCRIQPDRIWETSRLGLAELGLGAPCAKVNAAPTGTRYPIVQELVTRSFFVALTNAAKAAEDLPRKASLDSLLDAHHAISKSILFLLVLSTGHRRAEEYSYTPVGLRLDFGATLIGDKFTSLYHRQRIVPLADFVVPWLEFYFEWLSHLAFRLQRFDLRLARQVSSINKCEPLKCTLPLFFSLDRSLRVSPMGTEAIKDRLTEVGYSEAPGRHWLDEVARNAAMDGSAVTAWMGRGSNGQELFGRGSAAIHSDWLRVSRRVLNAAFEAMSLPTPPAINRRRLASPEAGDNAKLYLPKGLRRPGGGPERPRLRSAHFTKEPCPFTNFTLYGAAAFERLRRRFLQNLPINPYARLLLGMVLDAAITGEDVIVAIATNLANGSAFAIDEKIYVDFQTPRLGLRRFRLSRRVRAYLRALPAVLEDDWMAQAQQGCAEFLKSEPDWSNMSKSPLSFLSDCSAAISTLNFPSVVAWYAKGHVHSRICSPDLLRRLAESPTWTIYDDPKSPQRAVTPRSRESDEIAAIRNVAAPDETEKQKNFGRVESARRALERLRHMHPKPSSIAAQLAYRLVLQVVGKSREIGTALSYLSAVTPGLVAVARKYPHPTLLREVDVAALIQELVEFFRGLDSGDEGARDWPIAVNHLSRSVGLHIRVRGAEKKSGPPTQYAPVLNDTVLHAAWSWIHAQSHVANDSREAALALLELFASACARSSEVQALRLCDLQFTLGSSGDWVVIHPSAAGTKTDNAPRLLRLTAEFGAKSSLRDLVERRSLESARTRAAYLFGLPGRAGFREQSSMALSLVMDAIKGFCGDRLIDVRVFRHTNLTSRVHRVLKPTAKHTDFVGMRQALASTAAQSGHGHVLTNLSHYVHGLEDLHHDWCRAIFAPDGDIRIGYMEEEAATPRPPRVAETSHHSIQTESTFEMIPNNVSVGNLMLQVMQGIDVLTSARHVGVPTHWVQPISHALERVHLSGLIAHPDSAMPKFVADARLQPVCSALAPMTCTWLSALTLAGMLNAHGERWTVAHPRDVTEILVELVALLQSEAIGAILTVPTHDLDWLSQCNDQGWRDVFHVREVSAGPHRASVLFAPAEHLETSYARSSSNTTRLVSAAAIGLVVEFFLKESFSEH